jgi:transposase-like protein
VCCCSRSENILLGGEGIEVEMDESHIFSRKYNRGRFLAFQSVWVFGLIERLTKRVFVKQVENRNAETLYYVVKDHVREDSELFGDSWRGYSRIAQDFRLRTVYHSRHFVDPENPIIHTNNIERLWRSLKK